MNDIEIMEYLRNTKNLTLKEIGDIFCISRERVRQLIGNSGNKKSKRTKSKILNQGNEKLSNAELSKSLGLCEVTVSRYRRDILHKRDSNPEAFDVCNSILDMFSQNFGISGNWFPSKSHIVSLGGVLCKVLISKSSWNGGTKNKTSMYRFNTGHGVWGKHDVEFYILYIKPEDSYFVIPAEIAKPFIAFCWPYKKGKQSNWQQYHNRWDLVVDKISS